MKPLIRQKVNIVIDIVMFVVMIALAVIGGLIRYVLLSGADRWDRFGRNVDMTLLGLDRHQWGFIHLILGILLTVLLVLHIVFHWTQILCMIRRLFPKIRVRVAAMTGLVLLGSFFLLAPFFLPVEVGEPIRRQGEGFGRSVSQSVLDEETDAGEEEVKEPVQEQTKEPEKELLVADNGEEHKKEERHQHEEARVLEIKGYHTIAGLAGTHHVSAAEIKQKLNIPSGISNNERLGRIRRIYGFTMREVEDCILELKETN